MSDDSITIKIKASIDGEETDLSVSELGVLFTAINRCFNQIPLSDWHAVLDTPENPHFDRINYEPAFVELKVSSIKKGSVELEVFATALKFLNDLPEPQRTLILGALGSGTWEISKTFGKHFSRAAKRIAFASSGKVISVAIKLKNKTSKFSATFSSPGNVSTHSESSNPDDIQ